MAPAPKRIVVKLAASISCDPSANRVSSEFDANAIKARTVSAAVRAFMDASCLPLAEAALHDADVMALVVEREEQHLPHGQLAEERMRQLQAIEFRLRPARNGVAQIV